MATKKAAEDATQELLGQSEGEYNPDDAIDETGGEVEKVEPALKQDGPQEFYEDPVPENAPVQDRVPTYVKPSVVENSEGSVKTMQSSKRGVIHFMEDGFTAFGNVWYRGQEVAVTDDVYERETDLNGNSWLDMTENDQIERFGKVMWRWGPWPFLPYDDPRAQEAEDKRKGAVPKVPGAKSPK